MIGAMLRPYFRSGWAFLIPYLAAYLLYAWLKLPVNPSSGDGIGKVISGSAETSHSLLPSPFSLLHPPCLLHVYWVLHGFHLVLGATALLAWWKGLVPDKTKWGNRKESLAADALCPPPTASREATLNLSAGLSSGHPAPCTLPLAPSSHNTPSTEHRLLDTVYSLLPWVFLGLLFWIPGIYLEWPSDPWEHLRRINEWHLLDEVTAHSSWKKSSYFLPYSLTQHVTGLPQLSWLNLYYTAVCLLLSWQYHRLARAIGLGECASFVFVVLTALTFGNNIFSFYRYYGLSSTIFAQIGAVAITRIALEALSPFRGGKPKVKWHIEAPRPQSPASVLLSPLGPFYLLPLPVSLPLHILSTCALVALTAYNHIQGIGIAGLGVLATIVWRLIEWKRPMAIWLAGIAVLLSVATVLWFPRHPALDEVYRPNGWLTSWYGFNFFSSTSPAFDRSLQILGAAGILNLVFSLWLVFCRNNVAGWLTLLPVLALLLPCFALPFAARLALEPPLDNIIMFHRLLFAVPAGLAMVRVLTPSQVADATTAPSATRSRLSATLLHGIPALGLLALMTIPTGAAAFNRTWHAFGRTPCDMAQRDVLRDAARLDRSPAAPGLGRPLHVARPIDFLFAAAQIPRASFSFDRRITGQPEDSRAGQVTRFLDQLAAAVSSPATVYIPDASMMFSAFSPAAVLSRHWHPQEVALNMTGAAEAHDWLSRHRPHGSHLEQFASGAWVAAWEPPGTAEIRIPRPDLSLRYLHGNQPMADGSVRWLPFRRDAQTGAIGAARQGLTKFFTRSGRFKFKLRLLPAEGGADLLLNIDTVREPSAIYLIHHRSNDAYYYYVGRSEVGPWTPPRSLEGAVHELEFRWQDGNQALLVDGQVVLASTLPLESRLITSLMIGRQPDAPERALHGDLLIEDLAVTASKP